MHINCAFFVLRSLLIVAGFLKHIESVYVIITIEREVCGYGLYDRTDTRKDYSTSR